MLAVYNNDEEILVFEVNSEGKPIGDKPYFGKNNRDKKDYYFQLVEGAICIGARLKPDFDKILTRE